MLLNHSLHCREWKRDCKTLPLLIGSLKHEICCTSCFCVRKCIISIWLALLFNTHQIQRNFCVNKTQQCLLFFSHACPSLPFLRCYSLLGRHCKPPTFNQHAYRDRLGVLRKNNRFQTWCNSIAPSTGCWCELHPCRVSPRDCRKDIQSIQFAHTP